MIERPLRWCATFLALPVSFVLATYVGLICFGQIEAMCPRDWKAYPLCRWPWWVGHLSTWPFYFAFGTLSVMLVAIIAPKHKMNSGLIVLNGVGAVSALLSVVAWIAEDSLLKFWVGCVEDIALTYGGGLLGLIVGISVSKTITKIDPAWYEFRNAVYSKELARAEQMLLARPALLHMMNGLGETPLHFLAVENDIEGVAWLHARGANIDTKNAFGTPVIFEVAALEYKELFSWFRETGVDLKATDSEGNDILSHLLDFDHEEMATWLRDEGI